MISVRAIKVGKGSTYCFDQAIFHHSSQKITNLFHSQDPASKGIEIKVFQYMNNTQNTGNQAAIDGISPDNGIFECNCVTRQNMPVAYRGGWGWGVWGVQPHPEIPKF
jgi:hypothetical protein